MPMQRVKNSPDDIQFQWPRLWVCCILPIAIVCGQLFPIIDSDFEFYPQYAVTLSNAQLGQDPTFWHQGFSINIWFVSNVIEVGVLVVAYLLFVCTKRHKQDPIGVRQIRCCSSFLHRPIVCYPRRSLLLFLGTLFFFRSMWSVTNMLLYFKRTEGLCLLGFSYVCDRLGFPLILLVAMIRDTSRLRKIPYDGEFMTWCNLSDDSNRLRLDDVELHDVMPNSRKPRTLYHGRFCSVKVGYAAADPYDQMHRSQIHTYLHSCTSPLQSSMCNEWVKLTLGMMTAVKL